MHDKMEYVKSPPGLWQNSRVVKLLLFEILRNKVRRGKYGKEYNKTVAAAIPTDRDHISFFLP